jgi:hypothetical protein
MVQTRLRWNPQLIEKALLKMAQLLFPAIFLPFFR